MKESTKKADEILKIHIGNHYSDDNYIGNPYLNAMEEHAEEMACSFAEWIYIHDYYCVFSTKMWVKKGSSGKDKYTTKELYKIYLEHLNK